MIYRSAGHNPESPGACNKDLCEYHIASEWIDRIHTLIEKHYDSQIVPTGSLKDKVNYIRSNNDADIAIELHFNSNINAQGSECLYYPGSEKGWSLANLIQMAFKEKQIFQPNRGIKEGWYYSNGKKTDSVLYFLRETPCPAVIIEPEFIYNIMTIVNNYVDGCDAIAQGIINYYDNQNRRTR